jgi:HEAT repeat protein
VLEPSTAPSGLIAALSDSDARVQLSAAWALSEIRDAAAIPAIREALTRDAGERVRRAQIRALLHSGETAEQLVRHLESADADVRAAVAQGLAGRNHSSPWPWPRPRPRPFP